MNQEDMTETRADFPAFPPGLWRRIVLLPGDGWIGGALEDDMHRFHIRLDHANGRVTKVAAKAVRHPWSACPGATTFIARELTGELLTAVADRDPFQHCTHLYDLAVLAAAHADDDAPTRFDMTVADRVEGRTTATLAENGAEKLRWQLDGTAIGGHGCPRGQGPAPAFQMEARIACSGSRMGDAAAPCDLRVRRAAIYRA
ncbi:hypothetical protein KRR38_13965 [Novosphingobium sp. G106]|uniref:hypothetical protein n=1 Tax=Novosphingobium sp. G106 TaxID=2849500 RepID=UPI001C2D3312|nr:hypothetical protein [Novosphingobium sp. G106]MBV1688748.1 hypothetical protein [Novosphingobium sp. G106]